MSSNFEKHSGRTNETLCEKSFSSFKKQSFFATHPCRKAALIIGVVIVLVAGVIFFLNAKRQAGSPALYTQASVQKRDIVNTLNATGTVMPKESYTLSASVSGEVLETNFSIGDQVKTGDVLYVLANPTLDQNIEQAQNALSSAKANYEKALKSRDALSVKASAGGVVSEVAVRQGQSVKAGETLLVLQDGSVLTSPQAAVVAQVHAVVGQTVQKGTVLVVLSSEDVENKIALAKSTYTSADNELSKLVEQKKAYTITSPVNATVMQKMYKKGERIQAGAQICILYDLSALKVSLSIDELNILQVKQGQKVTMQSDAVEGAVFEGTVSQVGSAGTNANGVTTYSVSVTLLEKGTLLAGMNVSASIEVGSVQDVLSVPVGAVQRGNVVYVKTADQEQTSSASGKTVPEGYKPVYVETGITDGTYIEIVAGLQEGDIVLVYETSVEETQQDQPEASPLDVDAPYGLEGTRDHDAIPVGMQERMQG